MASAPEISPELVLVCPELADQERAALPDRPWELFVPSPPARPVPLGPAARVSPPRHQWPGRLASAFPLVLIAAFVAVILVGSLPWIGERPTLGPPPTRVRPTPVVTTPTLPVTPTTAVGHAVGRSLSDVSTR